MAEDAWGRTAESWDGMLIGGLGMFLGRHGQVVETGTGAQVGQVRRAELGWARYSRPPARAGSTTAGTGSRVTVSYGLILDAWNKGKTKTRIVI